MRPIHFPHDTNVLLVFGALLWASAARADWPDLRSIAPDLTPPAMQEGPAVAGRRVRVRLSDDRDSGVYHSLYLPSDWRPGKKYPVIVEYAGNGPFRNEIGDTCSGKVEDCNLGYGISGGHGYIWLCLPCISEDGTRNELQWWGNVEATVDYCKRAVSQVCQQYGGDSSELILAGFSRGSIGCNFIGLHDEEIANLWLGFICHSHYDGVRRWNYPGSDRVSAAIRLRRLRGRPQFICQERSVEETEAYLSEASPNGDFFFQPIGFRNHSDQWVLRDVPARKATS